MLGSSASRLAAPNKRGEVPCLVYLVVPCCRRSDSSSQTLQCRLSVRPIVCLSGCLFVSLWTPTSTTPTFWPPWPGMILSRDGWQRALSLCADEAKTLGGGGGLKIFWTWSRKVLKVAWNIPDFAQNYTSCPQVTLKGRTSQSDIGSPSLWWQGATKNTNLASFGCLLLTHVWTRVNWHITFCVGVLLQHISSCPQEFGVISNTRLISTCQSVSEWDVFFKFGH